MKNLGLHIAQVLNRNESVCLPGIGTLKPVHTSARFDHELNKFMPPVLAIQFDPASLQDEGAVPEEFHEELKQLKETLEQHGEVTIGGLGTLTKGEAFEFRFLPERENFYAFLPLPERTDIIQVSEPTPLPSIEHPENKAPQVVEDVIEDETESKNSWLKWVAIVVIGGAAVYGYYWYLGNSKNIQGPHSTNDLTAVHTMGDSMSSTIATDTGSTSLTDSTLQSPDTAISAASTAGDYEVIIASFRKLEEAQAYVSTMKDKGYELRILTPERAGNLHKVSYGAYRTKNEALVELRKVRKDLVAGAWLFEHHGN